MSQQNIKVKKVKAFPIAGQLKTASSLISMQVMKLTPLGFLAEISENTLQPGEKFDCTFDIPVMHRTINEPVVMIKLYNQWGGSLTDAPPASAGASTATGTSVLRLIEVHFVALSSAGKANIVAFLTSLQKQSL
jgi:hypothetical protein